MQRIQKAEHGIDKGRQVFSPDGVSPPDHGEFRVTKVSKEELFRCEGEERGRRQSRHDGAGAEECGPLPAERPGCATKKKNSQTEWREQRKKGETHAGRNTERETRDEKAPAPVLP